MSRSRINRRTAALSAAAALVISAGGAAALATTADADTADDVTCYADGSDGGWTHPFGFPQPAGRTVPKEGFNVAIEIPQGSFTKYEIDADTGAVIVDRFQSMPVTYPGNYGSIPQSAGGDGDPLDALVLTREPIAPGATIKAKAIAVLKMIDGGEPDDKIIAVPADDIDPDYAAINDIADLPEVEAQRIEAFFRVYKDLPEGRKKVELGGFRAGRTATGEVANAIGAYQKACAPK